MYPLLPQWALVILFFVLGACFGSFGNVIIFRLPKGETLGGRSHCQDTGRQLTWWENIPIISYFLLGGRSRYSHKPLSMQYPLIEFASAMLFVSTLLIMGISVIEAFILSLALWILLVIAMIDAKTQLISDALNLPFVALSLAFCFMTGRFDWLSFAISLVLIGGQWACSGGKWVGLGDVFLIVGIAALVGSWQHMLLCIVLSYIIGASVASVLLMTGIKKRRDTLAFAPFLGMGAYLTVLLGDWMLDAYGFIA